MPSVIMLNVTYKVSIVMVNVVILSVVVPYIGGAVSWPFLLARQVGCQCSYCLATTPTGTIFLITTLSILNVIVFGVVMSSVVASLVMR